MSITKKDIEDVVALLDKQDVPGDRLCAVHDEVWAELVEKNLIHEDKKGFYLQLKNGNTIRFMEIES